MIHAHSFDDLSLQNTWLTIGVFDGVHRGHEVILRRLVSDAHKSGGLAVVLTFTPHPAVVLGGKTDFKCLTTPGERLVLIKSLGVDVLISQNFNREFAAQSAEEFMGKLKHTLGMKHLLIGYDTALGRGREGNASRLKEIGKTLDFSVEIVPPLSDEKGVISSTRIRKSIVDGNVAEAAKELGHFYELTGTVVHGDGRGHRINVPTANIQVPEGKLIPANGIYACWAWVGNAGSQEKFAAATNVGVRPTFTPDLPAPAVEAHLLDFNRDLYGQQVRLEFVEFLRAEEKYASVDALLKQITEDVKLTRKILG